MTQQSPVSEASLTRLLAVLREQHTGAPTVAPLITRVADPTFRREAPASLARVVAQVKGRQRAASPQTAASPGAAASSGAAASQRTDEQGRAVVIPANLSGLLGAAGKPVR